MTCDEVEEQWLRDALSADAQRHAASCPKCAERLVQLDSALTEFHAGLGLEPLPPQAWSFTMPPLPSMALAAAAVFVIAFAGIRTIGPPETSGGGGVEAADSPSYPGAERLVRVGWFQLSEQEWQREVDRLAVEAEIAIVTADARPEAFMALVEAGRAAENANRPGPPYYVEHEGATYNAYQTEAARRLRANPKLAEGYPNPDSVLLIQALAAKPVPVLPDRSSWARRIAEQTRSSLGEEEWAAVARQLRPRAEALRLLGAKDAASLMVLAEAGRAAEYGQLDDAFESRGAKRVNLFLEAASQRRSSDSDTATWSAEARALVDAFGR